MRAGSAVRTDVQYVDYSKSKYLFLTGWLCNRTHQTPADALSCLY